MSGTVPRRNYGLDYKPNSRGRFRWVKRLVQGQNKHIVTTMRAPPYQRQLEIDLRRKGIVDDNSTHRSIRSGDFLSEEDVESGFSDNLSTTPLKSVVSQTSTTNPPSVLSGEHHTDNESLSAYTADTSLAPSAHVSLAPSVRTQVRSERERERDRSEYRDRDRDIESIVTLASSTRRVRRRSIDTNCSMAGIAPASIMERLQVTPVGYHGEAADAE